MGEYKEEDSAYDTIRKMLRFVVPLSESLWKGMKLRVEILRLYKNKGPNRIRSRIRIRNIATRTELQLRTAS
jgi:hypothetical protein